MVSTTSRNTPLKKIGIWLQAHLYLFFSMLRAKKITRSFLLCSIRETWGWIDWGSPIVVRAFGRACHKKILIFIMRIIITIINYKQHVNARETQRKHYCLFFFANLQKIFLLYIYMQATLCKLEWLVMGSDLRWESDLSLGLCLDSCIYDNSYTLTVLRSSLML